jgi:hypothetical protein
MEPIKLARKSSTAGRRQRAVESFKTAADCIGKVEPGMSLFAVTRGQFSMIDAVLRQRAEAIAQSCRVTAAERSKVSLFLHLPSDYREFALRALLRGWGGVEFVDAERFLAKTS